MEKKSPAPQKSQKHPPTQVFILEILKTCLDTALTCCSCPCIHLDQKPSPHLSTYWGCNFLSYLLGCCHMPRNVTCLHLWLIATRYICLLKWKITFHLKNFVMCSLSSTWPNPIPASTAACAKFWYDYLPSFHCQAVPVLLKVSWSGVTHCNCYFIFFFHNWQWILFLKCRAGVWALANPSSPAKV